MTQGCGGNLGGKSRFPDSEFLHLAKCGDRRSRDSGVLGYRPSFPSGSPMIPRTRDRPHGTHQPADPGEGLVNGLSSSPQRRPQTSPLVAIFFLPLVRTTKQIDWFVVCWWSGRTGAGARLRGAVAVLAVGGPNDMRAADPAATVVVLAEALGHGSRPTPGWGRTAPSHSQRPRTA